MTGPDYAQNLGRDGFAFRPYEQIKNGAPGFYLRQRECVWMRAGIINFRLCDQDYDCYQCPFDRHMRRAMRPPLDETEKTQVIHFKERYHVTAGGCIHYLSGRLAYPEACKGDYECHRCPVHQTLMNLEQDQDLDGPGLTNVSGYRVADGYYYHMGHAWAQVIQDGFVRIGIDDFSCRVFGPADEADLPPEGALLRQGEVGWVLSRRHGSAAMQSPVTGTVLAVNPRAKEHPQIAHTDPYRDGWLFLLDPADLKRDLKGLYFGKETFGWLENENRNLLNFLGEGCGRLAATGGEPVHDIFGQFPEIGWDRLVRSFLHTAQNT